jgi:nucleotide-binding universal stress UspA family protein
LDAANEIAQKFNAVLFALQVVQQVPPLVTGSDFAPMAIKGFDVPLYQEELLKSAENDLLQMVVHKVPLGIKVNPEVRVGITADVINEFAQEKNIDLIVMATHGRTGFSRFMIG